MADVIKKATRESYGEALKELAEECDKLVVLGDTKQCGIALAKIPGLESSFK